MRRWNVVHAHHYAAKMEEVNAAMLDGNGQCDTVVSECLGVVRQSKVLVISIMAHIFYSSLYTKECARAF